VLNWGFGLMAGMSKSGGFEPSYVETFMGGRFKLGNPKTVGELKRVLREMLVELDGWGGDETPIGEVWAKGDKIDVTLSEGITQ